MIVSAFGVSAVSSILFKSESGKISSKFNSALSVISSTCVCETVGTSLITSSEEVPANSSATIASSLSVSVKLC